MREGVPAQAIIVVGKSEMRLLVPTGDGVREPQNRRVGIVVQYGDDQQGGANLPLADTAGQFPAVSQCGPILTANVATISVVHRSFRQ